METFEERMDSLTKRFLFHSTLITAGVALIVLRSPSLSPLGLGLFLIAPSYSCTRKDKSPGIWWPIIITALGGGFFVWDLAHGTAFIRQPRPMPEAGNE